MIADRESLITDMVRGCLGEQRGPQRVLRVADLFCGAGGGADATRDAAERLGYTPEFTLVNHWPVAIATAKANFPAARVLCTSVENIIARHLYLRGQLDVLEGGPECIEFSRAASGRPKNDQYRPTPWCMLRFAEALLPRIVLIENVAEFETKWPPFASWIAAFESLGYKHGRRVFNAANYGDPTTRERLFMLFVLPPLKVVFPDPTHSRSPDSQLDAWLSAENHVVDWALKGRWIDEMPGKAQYGGLPLSPKTFGRIFDGLKIGGLKPVIVEFDNGSTKRGSRAASRPLSTVTSKARHGLAEAFFVNLRGTGKSRSIRKPVPTITSSGNNLALLETALIHTAHGGKRRARSLQEPLPTVTGRRGDMALVESFIVPGQGDRKGQRPRTHRITAPLPTVCASGHFNLVESFIIPQNTGTRTRSVKKPLHTVCGGSRSEALVSAHLLPQGGGGALRSVKKPAPTVATDGAIGLIEAFFVKYYGTAKSASIKEPLPTVTTKDRFALCCPVVVKAGKRLRLRLRWRMLVWYELAKAQGFRPGFKFCATKKRGKETEIGLEGGRKEDVVKQIGNAWPHNLARALMLAALTQQSDIRPFLRKAVKA